MIKQSGVKVFKISIQLPLTLIIFTLHASFFHKKRRKFHIISNNVTIEAN